MRRIRIARAARTSAVSAAWLLAWGAVSALCALPAQAGWIGHSGPPVVTTTQVLLDTSTGNLSTTSVRHLAPYSHGAGTSALIPGLFATAGAIKAMKCSTVTQPVNPASYTFQLMVNGSAASGASCVVDSTHAINDWTGTVAISPGDYVETQETPSGSPVATPGIISLVFQPSVAGETVLMAAALNAAFSTSAATGLMPMSGATPQTVTALSRRHGLLPDGGALSTLYVNTNDPTTASSNYAFAVMKNGSTTSAPNCTVNAGSTVCNDIVTAALSNTAGDDVEIQGTPTNGGSGAPVASTGAVGVKWVPTCSGLTGCFPLIMTSSAVDSATLVDFFPLEGGNGVGGTTEANVQNVSYSMIVRRLYARVLTAPGPGRSRSLTLRVNGVDTGLTCPISDTSTTCNFATDVTVANNDKLSIADMPCGATAPSGSSGPPACVSGTTTATGFIGVALLATR